MGRFVVRLAVPGNVLWRVMCAERCLRCPEELEVNKVGDAILEAIVQYGGTRHREKSHVPVQSPLFVHERR
jgi:hypothetical protein